MPYCSITFSELMRTYCLITPPDLRKITLINKVINNNLRLKRHSTDRVASALDFTAENASRISRYPLPNSSAYNSKTFAHNIPETMHDAIEQSAQMRIRILDMHTWPPGISHRASEGVSDVSWLSLQSRQ